MSIEAQQQHGEKVQRTLITIASEAGWPGGAGWPGYRVLVDVGDSLCLSVGCDRLIATCSGSGDPELQRLAFF